MTPRLNSLSRLAFFSLAAGALLLGCDDGGKAQVVPGDALDSSDTSGTADTDTAETGDAADATADSDAAGPGDADASETTPDTVPPQDVTDADDTDSGDADSGDAIDTSDDGGPIGLTISEEAISLACAQLCSEISTHCGTLVDLGDDTQGCEILCAERLGTDALWAGNYDCQRGACNASVCFATTAPIPEVTGCATFCAKAATCGEMEATGAPDGELGLCTAYCGGRATATPGGPAIVTCTNAALTAGTCGIGALQAACKLPVQGCDNLCNRFYAVNSPDHCYEEAPFLVTWPTVDKCITACGDLPESARAQFFGCVAANGCEDPTPCRSSVPTTQPACTSACEAGIAMCKGTYGGLATQSFCAGACSGAFKILDVAPGNANAAACVTSSNHCPEVGTNNRISVVGLAGCAAKISADCDTACSPFDACSTDLSDRLGCVSGCTGLETSDPATVQQIVQCVTTAAGDCDALDSCVPQ